MQGLRTKSEESGRVINPDIRGRYATGKSGVWETWYDSPHAGTKGGRNKSRSYTSTYAPGAYRIKTAKR